MRPRLAVLIVAIPLGAGCGSGGPTGGVGGSKAGADRPGLAEVDAPAEARVVAGQTIYVPTYSSILTGDDQQPYDLAVTLSVRNLDPARPLVLTAVRYYDHDGKLVRDFLARPLRVGPLAAAEYFVGERDRSGGFSSSFVVEWVAEEPVRPPIAETVMVGLASGRGIAFTCPGRVVSDRATTPEPRSVQFN